MCVKKIKQEATPEVIAKRQAVHTASNSFRQKVDSLIIDLLIHRKDYNIFQGAQTIKDIALHLYIALFNTVPHKIELEYDGDYMNPIADDAFSKSGRFADVHLGDMTLKVYDEEDISEPDKESHRTFKGEDIMDQYTILNLIDNYKGEEIAVYRIDEDSFFVFGDDIRSIMYKKDNYWYVLSPTEKLNQYIIDNVVTDPDSEDERYFQYVVYDNKGFDTTELPVKNQEINLEMNYNDDLPDEAIKSFLTSNDSGLCILFGAPGTGKTSYIRYLMHSCKKTDFIILNTSCFDAINDTSFINMIINNRDSVIILEDCEDLLVERLNGNSRIATLLNLSDGILGDALQLKFICTFNAKIGKIDSAVLRKGRTHVKYEFKPLVPAKAKALADSLNTVLPPKKGNEGYTLAEIYYSENDLVEGNVSTKVGF